MIRGDCAVHFLFCSHTCPDDILNIRRHSQFSGAKSYKFGSGAGESHAVMDDFVFVLGETGMLQVVHTTDQAKGATPPSHIVDVYDVSAPGTDVATCKAGDERLVAAATQGEKGKLDPGRVLLFTVNAEGKLTYKRTMVTGEGRLPDSILWTPDCRAIVAACEGEAVPTNSSLDNPEGGIAVVKFRADSQGNVADDAGANFKFISFAAEGYNEPSKRDPLLKAGVRWSLRPETKDAGFYDANEQKIDIPEEMTTFSRDLEPEYVVLSKDGNTVYVGLQVSCTEPH